MASKKTELIIEVEADTDQARRDLHAIEEVAEGLEDVELGVKADTDDAKRSVDDLIEDVEKLTAEDATIVLALRGAEIQREIEDIRIDLATLNATDAEVEVSIAQLGQLTGDLETIESKIKEIDAREATVDVRVDTTGVDQGLNQASDSTDRLSDSARGANNALANMVGNSAQDVGALAGVAGPAGVALGQMAEFASDAALSGESLGKALGSMAKVAGPIAALAGGVFVISEAIKAVGEDAQRTEDNINAIRDSMDGLQVSASELVAAIEVRPELLELPEQVTLSWEDYFDTVTDVLGGERDMVDVAALLDKANISRTLFAQAATGSIDDQAAAEAQLLAAREAGLVTQQEYLNILSAMDISRRLVTDAEEEAAIAARALAVTQDELNRILAEQADHQGNIDDAWATLNADLADGVINSQAATDAVNFLSAELGQLPADIIASAKEMESFGAGAQVTTGQLNELVRQTQVTNETFGQFDQQWNQIMSDLADGGGITDATTLAVNYLSDALDLPPDKIIEMAQAMGDERISEFANIVVDVAEAQKEFTAETLQMTNDLALMMAGFDEAAGRASALESALDGVNEASDLSEFEEISAVQGPLTDLTAAIQALRDSGVDLAATDFVPDTWDEIANMPEELQPVVDAFKQLREGIQSEMVEAFEHGGAEELTQWATDMRNGVIGEIKAMGLEADEEAALIQQTLHELGLTDEQINLVISTSGQEQARQVLGSLQGFINTFDPTLQLQITALMQTDPLAALQLVIAELEGRGVTIPASMQLLVDQLEADVGAVEEGPPAKIPAEVKLGDTVDLEAEIAEIKPELPATLKLDTDDADSKADALRRDQENDPVTLTAEANDDKAGRDLDTTADDRDTTINAGLQQQLVAGMLVSAFLDFAARTRQAQIIAKSDNAGQISGILDTVAHDRTVQLRVELVGVSAAEQQLAYLARNRTSTITVNTRTGSSRNGAAV